MRSRRRAIETFDEKQYSGTRAEHAASSPTVIQQSSDIKNEGKKGEHTLAKSLEHAMLALIVSVHTDSGRLEGDTFEQGA